MRRAGRTTTGQAKAFEQLGPRFLLPYQPQALFWRRSELRKQLETPLATTMAVKAPKLDTLAPAEAKRIDRLTLDHLFTFEHIQQQDGSIYLVLDRPS